MRQDSTNPTELERKIGKAVMEAMKGSVYARQMIQRIVGDVMQDVHESKDYGIPEIDLMDTNEELIALVALPGIAKDSIDLRATEVTLSIEAKPAEKEGKYVKREMSPKGMKREIRLPEEIKPEQVRASYNNGILEVHMPKLIVVTPHTVPVQ